MNLDSTLLQILAQGQDPRDFPFIDPPTPEAMAAALSSLDELGAVAELEPEPEPEAAPAGEAGEGGAGGSRLVCTPLGDALSVLPVDLSAGKMLLLSTIFDEVAPALRSLVTIAAAISVQSPLQRRRGGLAQSSAVDRDTDDAASRMKLQESFDSPHGEPFTLLNVSTRPNASLVLTFPIKSRDSPVVVGAGI